MANTGPIKVLYVEDSPREQKLFGVVAEIVGWQVAYASNGREALIPIAETRWDLIISDVQMPKMDGLELAHVLRVVPSPNSETPLVLATNAVTGEVAQRADELGVERVLGKPLLVPSLQLLERQLFGVQIPDDKSSGSAGGMVAGKPEIIALNPVGDLASTEPSGDDGVGEMAQIQRRPVRLRLIN